MQMSYSKILKIKTAMLVIYIRDISLIPGGYIFFSMTLNYLQFKYLAERNKFNVIYPSDTIHQLLDKSISI